MLPLQNRLYVYYKFWSGNIDDPYQNHIDMDIISEHVQQAYTNPIIDRKLSDVRTLIKALKQS